MVIPDQLRKSVAFVCYDDNEGRRRYAGTCFFFALMDKSGGFFRYTITAKHIIVNIRDKSKDGIIYLRVNLNDGGYEYIETNINDWFSNPDDPTDVSVLDWSPPPGDKYDVMHIADDVIHGPDIEIFERPGVGDDVAIIGLFVNHAGKIETSQ